MYKVSLKGIRISAPVGLYPQESVLGNNLEIDVTIMKVSTLDQLPFYDYSSLFLIVQKAASKKIALLEDLLKEVVMAIKTEYDGVQVKLAIRKLHPPLDGQIAFSEVAWED